MGGFRVLFRPAVLFSLMLLVSGSFMVFLSFVDVDLDEWDSLGYDELWFGFVVGAGGFSVRSYYSFGPLLSVSYIYSSDSIKVWVGFYYSDFSWFVDVGRVVDVVQILSVRVTLHFYKPVANDSYSMGLLNNLVSFNVVGNVKSIELHNDTVFQPPTSALNDSNVSLIGHATYICGYDAFLRKPPKRARYLRIFYGFLIVINRVVLKELLNSYNLKFIDFDIVGHQNVYYHVLSKMGAFAFQGALAIFLSALMMLRAIMGGGLGSSISGIFLRMMILGFILLLVGDIVYTYVWYKIVYMPVDWDVEVAPETGGIYSYSSRGKISDVVLPPIPFWSPGPWWKWFNEYVAPIIENNIKSFFSWEHASFYGEYVLSVFENPTLGYYLNYIQMLFALAYLSFISIIGGILLILIGYGGSKTLKMDKGVGEN